MATGSTLSEVVTMVRHEAGQSANAAVGKNTADAIRHMIRRTYERLWDEWPWPQRRIRRFETVAAGTRFYTLDADLPFDRVDEAWFKEVDGSDWHAVLYGVGPEQYNEHDSELDERADPVLRWEAYEGGQYEVWPIPEVDGGRLWFEGTKAAKQLTADNDTLELDDHMVALFVAAEILAKHKSQDAQAKLEQASARFGRLKGNSKRSRVTAIAPPRDVQLRGHAAHRPITVKAPGT